MSLGLRLSGFPVRGGRVLPLWGSLCWLGPSAWRPPLLPRFTSLTCSLPVGRPPLGPRAGAFALAPPLLWYFTAWRCDRHLTKNAASPQRGREMKVKSKKEKSLRKASISSVGTIGKRSRERPGSKKHRFSIKIIKKSIDFERRADRKVMPRAAGIVKASIFN